jgi:hypothetical protein
MERELNLTSRAEKAFSFAQETTKQQITLSTGVMALTLTFLKDAAEKGASRTALEVSWVLFVVSILAGVKTLMCLTGNLERPNSSTDSIYSSNIRGFAGAQTLTFLAALVCMVVYGFSAT